MHLLPLHCYFRFFFYLSLVFLYGCGPVWNDPHPQIEWGKNILYSAFTSPLKHLDPVQSYTEDEAVFLYQIYEPPLQYHYLKRPYTLIPGTAAAMPMIRFYDADGNILPPNTPATQIARSTYEIQIRPGILYQPHPAFATREDGTLSYFPLTPETLQNKYQITDFPEIGTRELTAEDFAYQIKRLAHPRLHSPIFDLMAQYMPSLKTLHIQLQEEAKQNAGWLDLTRYSLDEIEIIDRYTYKITLKGAYPQFAYWLSMHFFAPIPYEADRFFSQPGMAEKNLTLDAWPVGTGPYMLVENNPNARMRMVKNPHFRGEPYPCEGEADDLEAGLLDDCGKTMPFIDEISLSRERENIPLWNKFLQGYYDLSGISSDNFDQAINIGSDGNISLSENMQARGIHLHTAVSPSIFYFGFNMLDPVVGGGDTPEGKERARKLRQAISIAINIEEFISIFLNGRGVPAMHPLPPGLFGARTGQTNINPVVYTWQNNEAQRRSIEEAKRLLAEAGYASGRDNKTGEPLIIYLDTTSGGIGDKAMADWLTKQFRNLGVQFVIRPTDFNRLQDKMRQGQTQLFFLGWNVDYPDPENMFFLLYGPQGKVSAQGQNASNYINPAYDHLFEQMQAMPDGPARQVLIDQMISITQHDAPWVFGFHPMGYTLRHGWLYNIKPGKIIQNTLKYRRLDTLARDAARIRWNKPILWPLIVITLLGIAFITPAIRYWQRREQARIHHDTQQEHHY